MSEQTAGKASGSTPGELVDQAGRLADTLAHLMARRRTNGAVYMNGSHNPLPSEQRDAREFIRDHVVPLLTGLAQYGRSGEAS